MAKEITRDNICDILNELELLQINHALNLFFESRNKPRDESLYSQALLAMDSAKGLASLRELVCGSIRAVTEE